MKLLIKQLNEKYLVVYVSLWYTDTECVLQYFGSGTDMLVGGTLRESRFG